MINLTLAQLAAVLGADAGEHADLRFDGVTTDSRKACAGKLFVALRGPNFDAHRFVDDAWRNGAVAALVEREQQSRIAQIKVDDCKAALARLANHWRHLCDPCVIALTGSNGKTTVKEMLYRILAHEASSLATRGNLNNDIGVPLTLFELEAGQVYAVIEMGANHRGEIARLAEITEPDIVYVNNAAAAHLEGFGSLQGVVEAKGELYAWCGAEQRALFNLDESASDYWRDICAAREVLGCALDAAADVSARWSQRQDGLDIEFHYRRHKSACRVGVFGEHNVRNALAAVSLALLAGLELETAVANLDGFSGVGGRLQMLPGPHRSRLIDDSYNANPDSLEAGIRVLCALDGSPWLALGDMAELGADALELHRAAARCARDLGVEKMYAFGEMSCRASREFADAGYCFDDIESMAQRLEQELHEGVNLLIKGSRAAGMDRLVDLLARAPSVENANAV